MVTKTNWVCSWGIMKNATSLTPLPSVTLITLGKNVRRHFKIFFLIFPENRFDISCKLSQLETICMKNIETCFLGKYQFVVCWSSQESGNLLLGGDFNTVLDSNIDKHNGKNDTHKRCRTKINHIIDTYNLIDIWREKHFGLREYTWHSSHRPPTFCRLDYFLVSEDVRNFVISCKHNISYKSDHCPVSIWSFSTFSRSRLF